MTIYKLDEIAGITLNGNDLCADCFNVEELYKNNDAEIITNEDRENDQDTIYRCIECKNYF